MAQWLACLIHNFKVMGSNLLEGTTKVFRNVVICEEGGLEMREVREKQRKN